MDNHSEAIIGRRGRPKFSISRNQLQYLSSLSFNWNEISNLIGVSRMTLYRRRREFDLLSDGAPISDTDLQRELRRKRRQFPEMGETMILGCMRAQGYKVTRDRVRRILREIDPLNIALRGPRGLTVRQPCSVPGPNSLWHIGIDFVSTPCNTMRLCNVDLCSGDCLE